MIKRFIAFSGILMVVVITTAAAFSLYHPRAEQDIIKPDDKQSMICREVVNMVANMNYKKVAFNDSLSSVVFDAYLEEMDGGKVYFLASDIKKFEAYRNQFDDMLQVGELGVAFDMFNTYMNRYNDRIRFLIEHVKMEPDFNGKEEFVYNREKLKWFKDQAEMDAYWTLRIKYDLLNLKLAGSDSSKSTETLTKRYENLLSQSSKINSFDAFQAIMTAFTESVDPHTNYFNPSNAANFNIDMSRSLEGIGATLRMDNDFVTIYSIVPGGPADKSKLLSIDDRILGVAQGKDGEFTDIIGWRLDNAIQLIRGAKGTMVRLKILSKGEDVSSAPKIIELIREKIVLQDQSAKKEIRTIKRGNKEYKIGIINIPAFYADFKAYQAGDPNYKSTTRDVRLILDTLKSQKVDAVMIDLRSNGGGSLMEAIDLTGLFIRTGPVVQIRNTRNQIEVGSDDDPKVVWDGPLAVMIDRFSASASEIFAGAIQDYGRGIVLGTQSFGKGTVQNAIDLDQMLGNASSGSSVVGRTNSYGQINLTVAKFYRINGSSTQNKGVTPDISFPMIYPADKYGESAKKSALPWDEVRSANYSQFNNLTSVKNELKKEHEARMKNNKEYGYLLDDIKEFQKREKERSLVLNLEMMKKERTENEEQNLDRENERRKSRGLEPLKKGEKKPAGEKAYDFILDESCLIVGDYLALVKK